jgi:ferredoxin/flavodoxin---NADP+ reductase
MTQIGTSDNPLRVAIIGSGPSGFYAAEHLLKQKELTIEVDLYDRLPTPFGLVRGGVAPDHLKIKSVTKVYDRIAGRDGFRFFGNVNFGKDVTRAELANHYHAFIYTVGAQSDRNLNIPGEDLSGSHAATEFVAWYNGHPDFRDCEFDLSQKAAAVIGIGNVAMDVARILGRSRNELMESDIAAHALEALANSSITDIHVFGRRGPAQAAFTSKEIKEFGEMEDCDIIIEAKEMTLDDDSKAYLEGDNADRQHIRNFEIMSEFVERKPEGRKKRIHMHFLASPTELTGDGHVEKMKIVRNELYKTDRGDMRPRATENFENFDVGLVFRSVGYRGVPLADVPFYDSWGIIPNRDGRVLTEHETGQHVTGDYTAGWIKRGPSGVVGTNKPCAVETVNMLLEDMEAGKLLEPAEASRDAVEKLLNERNIRFVTYADWLILDKLELANGEATGRPRVKFTNVAEMLKVLEENK